MTPSTDNVKFGGPPLVDGVHDLIHGWNASPYGFGGYVDLHNHGRGSTHWALVKAKNLDKFGFEQNADNKWLWADPNHADVPVQEVPLTPQDFRRFLRYKPDYGVTGADGFDLKIHNLKYHAIADQIKTLGDIYLSAYFYMLDAGFQGLRYFEYRVSPKGTLSEQKPGQMKGAVFNTEQMVQVLEQGFKDAGYYLNKLGRKVDYGIIFGAYRSASAPVDNVETVEALQRNAVAAAKETVKMREKGYPIVGFDLNRVEQWGPVYLFKDAFDVIKDHNRRMMAPGGDPSKRIGLAVHAGEVEHSAVYSEDPSAVGLPPAERKAKAPVIDTSYPQLSGFESIEKTIQLCLDENTPVRIGHGVQLFTQPPTMNDAEFAQRRDKLLDTIRKNNIVFEISLKSNVLTRAVRAHEAHPVRQFIENKIPFTLCTDNMTIAHTNMPREFEKFFLYLGGLHEHRKLISLNAANAAFIFDKDKKREIMTDIKRAFDELPKLDGLGRAILREAGTYRSMIPQAKRDRELKGFKAFDIPDDPLGTHALDYMSVPGYEGNVHALRRYYDVAAAHLRAWLSGRSSNRNN